MAAKRSSRSRDSILQSSEFRVSQRIKHVMAAVRVGLAGGPDAETAAAYVAWMARRQYDGGAAYLDLNVDEIDHDVEGRLAAMVWLVGAVGPVTTVPLSIDSSDAAVLQAGLDPIDPAWADGARPMINSASMERPQTLDLCRERGLPVVLSCTGDTMPSDAPERMHAREGHRRCRARQGPAAGRPVRRHARHPHRRRSRGRQLLPRCGPLRTRDVRPGHPYHRRRVERLVRPAGAAAHQRRLPRPVRPGGAGQRHRGPGRRRHPTALRPERDAEPYRLAADMLTGRDAFGVEFIDAYRAGKLS